MRHHVHWKYDVLVVGGGAAGLAAAVTLGRHGIDTLVVEKRPAPSTWPRATVISTRAMEHVRAWGLEAEVRAEGPDADVWLWECASLASADDGRAVAVGYPTREQAARVSPTAPAVVAQDRFEAVLRRHLTTLPTVRVVSGVEIADVASTGDGVVATTADGRTLRARYLVGADGAHSAVRRAVGIGVRGDEEGVLTGTHAVVRAPLAEVLGEVRFGLYWVTDTPGLYLPAGGDRWIVAPDEDLEDPDAIVAGVRRGAGDPHLDVRVESVRRVRAAAHLAESFRAGDVFLAGDAVHRVTPRGGTGMNTALQSGVDLAWKLAWVLRGWAGPELLDTYEAERRPVAEHVVARSTDPDGSRRDVATELAVDLGARLPHVVLPDGSSTLDLLGPGWTVLAGPRADAAGLAVVRSGSAPVAVHTLDTRAARTLGLGADGTLLARPDGVPVARCSGAVATPRPAAA
ncbi:FAD-dependent monooxygenase [Actinomycetospora lutea]|uniref:FAD-dependent monooxygenase n=1 Tax=Actinomycetospora lutea TaxID=663604 RepID=UPI002365AE58|nr:FAD-dependent monooxygenase [Actinomycetospora lutea]MDD7941808.1 FAD-dependent monooxygenase [Actinomycetospora lutea]